MSDEFIRVKNLTKRFDDVTALNNVNLSIGKGEIYGLMGKSGAGKSVLMHAIRGSTEYKPQEGQIIFNLLVCPECMWVEPAGSSSTCPRCQEEMEQQDVDYWNANRDLFRAIRSRIAIMLQRSFSLFGDKSTIENVLEAINDPYMTKSEKAEFAMNLLEKVDMTHRTTHIARDLSGGEKQRVVLARQLAKKPMLLLADEPTGTLDPKSADTVHNMLSYKADREGLTVITASHWPDVIRDISDRGAWLESGELVKEGSPEEITEEFIKIQGPTAPKEVDFEDTIVRVQDAKKYFYSVKRGVVKAVDGVSLEIDEKEIFGLVGWSGSGKTTLARMISGITEPDNGDVEVRIGDDWIDMSKKGPRGKGRATPHLEILHQEHSLHPYSTVFENLSTAIGTKLPEEFVRIKAQETLEGLGMTESRVESILDSLPRSLSVGEDQRVALAQVLMKEPTLNILDEPAGTLDPVTKAEVAESIVSAREELGATFLIISHDKDFILDTCDRACLMSNGKIVVSGDPEKVVNKLVEEKEVQV
ncbi:methyl coenzyme M reductase system, component A2 [Methanonatronarchaeum sp. AMET-Sl]|uniref:methyl coenzyme M reductase system, component A2 n=1 Tax=Methanonatronarchaeum sp. AMET-Sl TaxID=3037654 RepID=UPI00244E111D|nr:methyl coenzyme M reductase system, component A2 [Methanonatronarchaeum sp. AMET-Sl]WGI17835.1 methyl coenzyme M reductase system, component A2 [Methanonatronarchaeum sp. AMET-Sl]